MKSLPVTSSYCGTCKFWTGRRKPDSLRNFIECDDEWVKGECAGGGWNRHTKEAMHSCSSWEPLYGKQNNNTESNNSYTSSAKKNNSSNVTYSNNNRTYGNRRMHWLYFLLIGWWLGLCMICMIFPLFIRGLVKKSFGYW
jgi:hypothetical protein